MKKSASIFTPQVLLDGLAYLLRGGFRLKNSHLPQNQQKIPADFMGLCVATATEAETDAYVIVQLHDLGIRRVRLDISDDACFVQQARLLQTLLAAKFQVDLHLVQPFAAAQRMHEPTAQQAWQQFVHAVLSRYAKSIASVEIGNTLNRKKWAGYTMAGFMHAWQMAYDMAKQQGVLVIGPNIQDFEPFYNISLLKQLRQQGRLPDLHSNNLFVERVVEPEQYDYRILKYQWTRCLRFNLIKKARLLQKIGQEAGVSRLVSPVAFWAIYRIQRRLPDGKQKQADYVTRYFTLLAASGAVQQANWGAMICQREGLIDNGVDDDDYPALEQVAYYAAADGERQAYQRNPSFNAFKTIAHWLNGAQYVSAICTGNGIEIHHLRQHAKDVHIAWTVNGQCALLASLYTPQSLQQATFLHRDGEVIAPPALITETPMYLCWKQASDMVLTSYQPCLTGTVIHAHLQGLQYFPIQSGEWRGMLLAESAEQAAQLWQAWHPEALTIPEKNQTLRHARNAIWSLPDPRDPTQQVTVKQPVKMHVHKQLLDRFKPSKAKRSWNGAMECLRRGIGTAMPLAYIEHSNDSRLRKNYYICAYVPHDFAISQAFLAFKQGESHFQGILAHDLYLAFAKFCSHMHRSGIYFRDFSGGNILVQAQAGTLKFVLIDTARLRATPTATPHAQRIADLTRALNKLHWAGRKQFLNLYLGLSGRPLDWRCLWPFYVYDAKVTLKRTIGRKGLRKLLRYLKSWAN